MPNEGFYCTYLSVILIEYVFGIGKNYYTLVFLEECKYVAKETELTRYIAKDLEFSDKSDQSKYI